MNVSVIRLALTQGQRKPHQFVYILSRGKNPN